MLSAHNSISGLYQLARENNPVVNFVLNNNVRIWTLTLSETDPFVYKSCIKRFIVFLIKHTASDIIIRRTKTPMLKVGKELAW